MRRAHVAVLLAAGGSRRLGRPKQLLPRHGMPLLRHVVEQVATTRPVRTVVVTGGHRARVDAALEACDDLVALERIHNPDWAAGLAGSLALAAQALSGHDGPVLVVGCDQPALNGLHLRALLDGAASVRAGCAAVMHGDRPGIPAVLSATLFATAPTLHGDRGFGAALAALPEGELFCLQAPLLACDLDTEDDVRVAIAQGWLDADA